MGTSLVFGNYLAHYHFFGNQPAPIRYAKELLAYCNSAGENPNSVDMVLKNYNNWLEAGYFTYHAAAPTKDTSALQPGIAKKVWSAEVVGFSLEEPDAGGARNNELATSDDEGVHPEESEYLVEEDVSGSLVPLDFSHELEA